MENSIYEKSNGKAIMESFDQKLVESVKYYQKEAEKTDNLEWLYRIYGILEGISLMANTVLTQNCSIMVQLYTLMRYIEDKREELK